MRHLGRFAAWLAGLWAGALWCIALLAAPAAFAVLARPDAGRLVGRLFAHEAALSLAVAALLLLAERRRTRDAGAAALSANALLALAALFCTVAGYYALQPMLEQARLGQGSWSFGALHAASTVFYGVKTLAASVLAWRLAAGAVSPATPS
jgi:hypothetical protein